MGAKASAYLATRLRERRGEIEQAVLARVDAVSDPSEVDDPSYALGLRDAVGVALDYSIDTIEADHPARAVLPDVLLAQARAAARNDVCLDTVLRRYMSGYTLLGDYLIQEAAGLGQTDLPEVMRTFASTFDKLVAAVARAHTEEAESRHRSPARRHGERIKGLLRGESIDAADLRYEFDAWHLAAVAAGPSAVASLRDLAAALDRSLLLAHPGRGQIWAWLGGTTRLSARDTLRRVRQCIPAEVSVALGEPGRRIDGWRLTHRQAKAAMSVARRGPDQQLRYADVALLAAALRDDLLIKSLHGLYLTPLQSRRERGVDLLETLRAYFAAGRNASSAAVALGVSRQTVNSRLRAIEERIDRPLLDYAADLETAIRLRDLR